MSNSTNNITAEVREGDQLQVPGSNPVQGWHLLSRSSHQNCLSICSNDQIKQDLAVQHHQLCEQIQALQASLSAPSSSTAVKHGPCLLTLKKRIQTFKTKCLRNLLRIYLEHKTNEWVRSKINFLVGPQEPLQATVERRKPAQACHTP